MTTYRDSDRAGRARDASDRTALVRAALVALMLVFGVVALVLRLERPAVGAGHPADPRRTPGMLNPDVTQATIGSTVCAPGWTRTVRPPVEYTNALKRKQMRAYGRPDRRRPTRRTT